MRHKLTVLMKTERQWITQTVKAIPGQFQHALVVADMDEKKIKNVVRKTYTERRKISLLKDVKIVKQYEEKAIELADGGSPNLWRNFEDWDLKACDEVCGKKRGRRSKGGNWWWNEEV